MLSTIEGLIWFQKDRFVTYDWGFFKVSDSRLYIQRFAEARPHQYIVIDETWQIDNDSTLTRPFSLYSYSKEAMVDTVEKYNFYWTEKKLDSTSFVLKNKEKLDRTLSRVRSHRE